MYGHNRNTGIRVIPRYEEALNRITKTKPIAGNGRNKGIIPLGHRRHAHYQLRMRRDESIACKLYRTDVVVFDKDGTITIDPAGYSTISTAAFISEVLGVNARQSDNRLVVNIEGGWYEADKLKLRPLDAWSYRYEVLESNQGVVHGLDRKGMNALRRDTQEFRKFLSGLMKIKDYTVTEEELHELTLRGKTANHRLTLDLWRTNADDELARFKEFEGLLKSGDAEN